MIYKRRKLFALTVFFLVLVVTLWYYWIDILVDFPELFVVYTIFITISLWLCGYFWCRYQEYGYLPKVSPKDFGSSYFLVEAKYTNGDYLVVIDEKDCTARLIGYKEPLAIGTSYHFHKNWSIGQQKYIFEAHKKKVLNEK